MAEISSPQPYTGWPVSEAIHFKGRAKNNGEGLTFDYHWSFGDGTSYDDTGLSSGENSSVTHTYSEPGTYTVTLLVSGSDGSVDSETETIYLVSPVPRNFSCSLKLGSCDFSEIELLRLADTTALQGKVTNTHARGFDDPDKDSFPYTICCKTSILTTHTATNDFNPDYISRVYAILYNDSDSLSGGAHNTKPHFARISYPQVTINNNEVGVCNDSTSINEYCLEQGFISGAVGEVFATNTNCANYNNGWTTTTGSKATAICFNNLVAKYYYLDGVGAGVSCQVTSGDCSDLSGNKQCLYEFYTPSNGLSAHFAECTAPGEPDNYPYKMCCEISEDCTNNYDDDGNGWSDTADNDLATGNLVCPAGTVCGVSNAPSFTPNNECAWMLDYCEGDYCSFQQLGVPEGYISRVPDPDNPEQTVSGWAVSDYYSGCVYYVNSSGAVALSPTASPDCPSMPSFNYSDSLIATAEALNVSVFELHNRCRFFHCSKGNDPNNPLPAYVQDMNLDSRLTRHVCKIGRYWDPEYDANNDGVVEGGCRDFGECYFPRDPAQAECQYDYLTEFDQWLLEAMPFDPEVDKDCFDSTPGYNAMACCPIYQNNENTYDYKAVEFYIQE